MKLFLVLLLVLTSSTTTIDHLIKSKIDEVSRKKIATDIITNLSQEDYEAVRKDFHSSLKTTLPVEKIAEIWKTIVTNSGGFKKIISTTTAITQGYNQVFIRIELEKENATLETTFTADDKVIGLYIKP
jgi:hypothetical protein